MKQAWWKERVFYQIYPRSFLDTNGDGIGDLRGIIEKLDYLKTLGIGGIWLCPVYDSPNDDNGYDIRDYENIMSEFGTMTDFDALLEGLHARDIKLVMDLVVNHSSDEHAWFTESRKAKDNPYRDYYIWRDGKDGGTPNNWASFFAPSAWKLDETTGQYYLHLFSEKQPDLNWENPRVRSEIHAMVNRWFDRGVDGFRMDVINCIAKDAGLPDGAGRPNAAGYTLAVERFANRPKFFDYIRELKENCYAGRDCLCLAEAPFTSPEEGTKMLDEDTGIFDLNFPFDLMEIDDGPGGKYDPGSWTLQQFKQIVSRWQVATEHGWGSLFWSNHDQARAVSRFGCTSSEELRIRSAKMLAVAMYLLRGTPFVYQGEELGMTNTRFPNESTIRDIEGINALNEARATGRIETTWKGILHKGRDHARTPMQWSTAPNAGFTTGEPWIMVNPNYVSINAETEQGDANSVLKFYQTLIGLRNSSRTLQYGDYRPLLIEHEELFVYQRVMNGETYTIVCNMSGENVALPEIPMGSVILSNVTQSIERTMAPYEARVMCC
ncbi:MAG TPA: alpha-glucosidase [Clostridia bacterium]|nr:alpha-glucosidase [Clostridia bacterium]